MLPPGRVKLGVACGLSFLFVDFQILSYTKGTKALIRQATASDYHESTSVSNAAPNEEKKPKRKLNSRENERNVSIQLTHYWSMIA